MKRRIASDTKHVDTNDAFVTRRVFARCNQRQDRGGRASRLAEISAITVDARAQTNYYNNTFPLGTRRDKYRRRRPAPGGK